ncbi:MAG: hypothetical protein ACK5BJ_13240 [Bacteroidota bacterium]|jgi:hypothetical protein|nr:hypothetical protein [Cytophagales bacterium]
MKTLLITMATLLVYAVGAQTHSDKIVRELAFEKSNENNTLILANINGSMKVEGYNGTKVLIEVTRVLTAKTDAGLEKAKQEVVVEQIDRADTLIVYVNDGCNHFSYDTKFRKHKGWAYSGHHDAGCDMLYDYKTEFIVKVPYAIHLNVSTINAGDISVENVSGMVVANNINWKHQTQGFEICHQSNHHQWKCRFRICRKPNERLSLLHVKWQHQCMVPKRVGSQSQFQKF